MRARVVCVTTLIFDIFTTFWYTVGSFIGIGELGVGLYPKTSEPQKKEVTQMGNLIKETPYSEITATLEALDRAGVSREGLARIRKDRNLADKIAGLLKIFPIWRTITLGISLKTGKDFCLAIKQAGCRVSGWAKEMMSTPQFIVADKRMEVTLCVATTAELTGNHNGGITAEVFDGIKRIGGELCPPEIGPQLRLQYHGLIDERLLVAMEPITDSDGNPGVFSVVFDESGLWLSSSSGGPYCFWRGDVRWVFVSPR